MVKGVDESDVQGGQVGSDLVEEGPLEGLLGGGKGGMGEVDLHEGILPDLGRIVMGKWRSRNRLPKLDPIDLLIPPDSVVYCLDRYVQGNADRHVSYGHTYPSRARTGVPLSSCPESNSDFTSGKTL